MTPEPRRNKSREVNAECPTLGPLTTSGSKIKTKTLLIQTSHGTYNKNSATRSMLYIFRTKNVCLEHRIK